MAQYLSHDSFGHKLARERITKKLGPALTADLYPNRSWRDRVPGSSAEAAPPEKSSGDDPDDEDDSGDDIQFTRLLAPLRDDTAEVPRPGSNNWVISGAHTVSGRPILANDMHLGHQIPNIWYEAQLTAGDFNVVGVTLPGLPFVIVGHNRRIAWGFTNLGPDVEDIFVENFNAQGEYQTPHGWQRPEVRHETIGVKGAPDFHFDVVSTRHGPIVTALAPGETRKIALQWTILRLGMGMPFGEINAASNWQEFRAALRKFTAPSQNAVYADVDGHIGYQATGTIPLRKSGDGSLPVPGNDDAREWMGYIPFEKLPSVYDPSSGILATANGRIAADNYPLPLSSEWGTPYRTERIYRVLESGRKFVPADMLALQTDVYSAFDQFCAEKFVQAVEHSSQASARARRAADILSSWDGRLTTDSAAGTIETAARKILFRLLLQPKLGPAWLNYEWFNSHTALENLLTRQPKAWLPDRYASYDALLLAALEESLKDAPRDLDSWRWGEYSPLVIQHPIFGKIPLLRRWSGPGTVEQSGGGETVKQVGRSFGPSERMTVDFSNFDESTLNIVTGESGNLLSPHFMDQWKAWYEGTTFALPFSEPAVERAAHHRLQLVPAK
jgi:penicillin amidase